MLQLTADEAESLRSQFATLKVGRGQHRKYRPYAFTEQGSRCCRPSLNSERAIEVNIAIMRAFVRLRQIMSTHKDLACASSRRWSENSASMDEHFHVVFEAIRPTDAPPSPAGKKGRIGFHAG